MPVHHARRGRQSARFAVRTDRWTGFAKGARRYVLFGHHFAAIAGAGPFFGPVLAAQTGYLVALVFGAAAFDAIGILGWPFVPVLAVLSRILPLTRCQDFDAVSVARLRVVLAGRSCKSLRTSRKIAPARAGGVLEKGLSIGTLSPGARRLSLAVFAAALAAVLGGVLFWRPEARVQSVERDVRAVDPGRIVEALEAERERRLASERQVVELESRRMQADTAAREAAEAQQAAADALARAGEDRRRAVENDLVARLRSNPGPRTRGLSLSNESKSADDPALEAARAAEAARAGELAKARDAASRTQAEQQRLARDVDAALKREASLNPAGVDPIEAALAKAAQPLQVAIQIPASLDVGHTYTARVVVARGAGSGSAAAVDRFVTETRAPVARQIATESTDELSAVASGTRLKTTPLSDAWQTLRRDKAYKWEWTVEPTEQGQGALLIELRQRLIVEGRERVVNVDQFPVSVAINVTTWSRIVEAAGAAGPPLKNAEDIVKGLSAIIGAVSATWLMRRRIVALATRLFARRRVDPAT